MKRSALLSMDRSKLRRMLPVAACAAALAAGAAGAQTVPESSAQPPAAAPAGEAAPQKTLALPPEEPIPSAALKPAEPAPPPAAEPTPAPAPAVAVQAEPAPPAEPEPPAKRARYDVAVLQALDKITAETVRFEAEVGKPVRYKSLVFTVRACERSTPDEETPDAIAYLTIQSQPKAAPGKPTPAPRQVFRGWMFASSPGLDPLEHPVYDAWLITCRAAAPS
ncbi:DUF2155 domain-containing protein [Phenylobacterium sp.]|uniref:DUF2155 domain-containing protein n=1 Tax=Phenylobacterium sp. TaxID=1871053 RepID=UPI0035B391E7